MAGQLLDSKTQVRSLVVPCGDDQHQDVANHTTHHQALVNGLQYMALKCFSVQSTLKALGTIVAETWYIELFTHQKLILTCRHP